ncbi:ribosome biogenesis protein [Candidatus Woesearchaeota archaeon]|nr:ribosome biogenesis protein [Candidatus Woesearchaeota archaeon]
MSPSILYCSHCKSYTMETLCKMCGAVTLSTKPAKFSIEDKWGKYRRVYKEEHSKDL